MLIRVGQGLRDWIHRVEGSSAIGFWTVLAISTLEGMRAFFSNQDIPLNFAPGYVEWYVDLSKNIYSPNTAYYAESILLPLLANIVGASTSLHAYKILCALITISITPILVMGYFSQSRSMVKSLLLLAVFSLSFPYTRHYILGFPDPLTIVLVILAALHTNKTQLFLFIALAGLSHFALAVFSSIGLLLISMSSCNSKREQWDTFKTIIGALIAGRICLSIWYRVFHYTLETRIDWVLDKGLDFFIARVVEDPLGFFATPGALFLISSSLMFIVLIAQRRYITSVAFVLSGALAYLALFLTVDGQRIFLVAIAGAYTSSLLLVINGSRLPKETCGQT